MGHEGHENIGSNPYENKYIRKYTYIHIYIYMSMKICVFLYVALS